MKWAAPSGSGRSGGVSTDRKRARWTSPVEPRYVGGGYDMAGGYPRSLLALRSPDSGVHQRCEHDGQAGPQENQQPVVGFGLHQGRDTGDDHRDRDQEREEEAAGVEQQLRLLVLERLLLDGGDPVEQLENGARLLDLLGEAVGADVVRVLLVGGRGLLGGRLVQRRQRRARTSRLLLQSLLGPRVGPAHLRVEAPRPAAPYPSVGVLQLVLHLQQEGVEGRVELRLLNGVQDVVRAPQLT